MLPAEGFETGGGSQHLPPLLGQGRQSLGELGLLGHPDLQDLVRFGAGGAATQSGQARRDPVRILELARPVLFGQAEQRFDGIRADGQAALGQPERRGDLELGLEIMSKRAAHCGGGDRSDQRLTLGQRRVTQALGFENLLAGQQRERVRVKPLDERFTGGSLVEAGAQLGQRGALGRAARWGEPQHPLGPADEAMHVHKAGFGLHLGGR